ncbi:MAG: hypothetical protein JXB00_10095 [Bacteroidales bacterium]|nr:hypothetical protein [Bacteroidales bacterium]
MRRFVFILLITVIIPLLQTQGQNKLRPDSALINGIALRGIGPAMSSGRISDFAINPQNPFEYYVAVASGHIWKTTNNGVTWKPVFENYGAYAIGCLAIDPVNPNVIWAGTGENNSQRALGYGNGIYKSLDAGNSWKNMGLKSSRQTGKILIDPRNTDVVYVAAEGSVWGPGGERGIYKTLDGGKSWNKILNISENTGAYDLEFHPLNPDIIYASVHQRRRRTFTKINGGPESGFYKSTDGGKEWRKITSGLPETHLGRIGIDVTPADANLVYAIVEAADGKGGFFRSSDQGESWEKMSDYTSSGQYYTEIYCDPVDPDRIFSMDTYSKVTCDAGKTWKNLSNKNRHVDDHALWINPKATNHLRIGGDGGIYESFDNGENWHFTANLPVTQFYRVNVDNSEPFYYVYGGTQDNNTLGGPSQNLTTSGVINDEWFVTIGGDGFWVAIDPDDPNIVYSEYQYGNAYRYNRKNGEIVYIKPQERKDELTYKWNWDTPLILSRFSNTRLYMAANKVFMSENRGDSWTVISDDLTAQIDRNSFKVMGKYWGSDAVTKDVSTSQYGTIVALAESPLKEGMLYTGSDDGVIQVTEDNGKTWRKTSTFPGVPQYTYVSDIFPSRFDENVVYATFNNHKNDDFKPYILISRDKAKTWSPVSSNLPEGAVYTIVQDFIDSEMLFCGTEFGLFVTFSNGKDWLEITNGLPDIAVRDLAIQERECDLVLATFGRGFYILHDYSALRDIKNIDTTTSAHIFKIKDAKLYIRFERRTDSFGDDFFVTGNLPFGAEFTFYLKEDIQTTKEKRHKKEAELFKTGEKIDVNTWEDDRLEKLEEKPYLLFVIEDKEGKTLRKMAAEAKKGIHRAYWDLKYPDIMPVKTDITAFDPLKEAEGSIYAMPGEYYVSLFASEKGELTPLTEKVSFKVKALDISGFNHTDRIATLNFQKHISNLYREAQRSNQELNKVKNEIQQLKLANLKGGNFDPGLNKKLTEAEKTADDLSLLLNGYTPKASPEEIPPSRVPVMQRLSFIVEAFYRSSEPTNEAQKLSAAIAEEEFNMMITSLEKLKSDIEALKKAINQSF